jgi:iron(III) transport system substrate-binding protein
MVDRSAGLYHAEYLVSERVERGVLGEATGLAKGDIGMRTISSRIGFLLAMLGLVAAGISGAAAQSDQEKSLYDAAKKEGKLTWYTAQFDQALATKIGNTFTQKYPGVQVNVIKATAQVAFQRLLQDIKAGQIQSDVYSTTDMSQFVYLKEKGELVTYMMPEAEKKIVPAFQNIDPDGYYHVSASGLVAITYNKEKVKEVDAPKNWTDLTDPKWAGQVAIGDPNYSGMVGVWTVAMAKLYGWDFFSRLNAVKPLIGRSIDDTVTMLNAGERMVAAGDPASTLRSAAKGNPLGVIYPTDGAVAIAMPSGIIKNSSSPNAAKLFMEFLLSAENAKLVSENFEQSVRSDVVPPPGAKSLGEVKVVSPTSQEITQNLPGNKEKWKETFGM